MDGARKQRRPSESFFFSENRSQPDDRRQRNASSGCRRESDSWLAGCCTGSFPTRQYMTISDKQIKQSPPLRVARTTTTATCPSYHTCQSRTNRSVSSTSSFRLLLCCVGGSFRVWIFFSLIARSPFAPHRFPLAAAAATISDSSDRARCVSFVFLVRYVSLTRFVPAFSLRPRVRPQKNPPYSNNKTVLLK